MKKLSLNRETIRNLDERDLERVHGGDVVSIPPECDTHGYCVTDNCVSHNCQIQTVIPVCIVHTMEC